MRALAGRVRPGRLEVRQPDPARRAALPAAQALVAALADDTGAIGDHGSGRRRPHPFRRGRCPHRLMPYAASSVAVRTRMSCANSAIGPNVSRHVGHGCQCRSPSAVRSTTGARDSVRCAGLVHRRWQTSREQRHVRTLHRPCLPHRVVTVRLDRLTGQVNAAGPVRLVQRSDHVCEASGADPGAVGAGAQQGSSGSGAAPTVT